MKKILSSVRVRTVLVPVLMLGMLAVQIPLALPAHAAVADWIKAASFLPSSTTDFNSDSFKQSVRNFQAVGGNYVNLVIPYYQSNLGSTDINPGGNTPSDATLVSAIQYVHSLGMHVQLSIYLESYTGDWRAYINPSDRDTWYKNYGNVLVHYGQLAQQQGVELYMLGAELISMASASANGDNTERWDGMIDRVRGVYSGALTYSANRGQQGWASELPNIGFWDKLDYVGISAYYELPGDGSVASLESDWQGPNNYDVSPAQRFGKPIIFTEIGYRSVSNAHSQPWNSGMSGSYDPQEQANDYTALLEYWNNYSYMHGVDLWWWSPNPNYGGSGNTDYTPQNKPAQDVLKQWWTGGNAGGGTTPPPQSGTPAFKTSGAANPPSPAAGQNTGISASVTDSGDATNGAVVDLEVYDGGTQVFQKFFSGQNFSSGQTQQYNASFTPGSAGTYTLKVGVFNSDWSKNYTWNDSAATITVGSGGSSTPPPTNPPPSSGQTTDVWWPTDGAHVSGLQPFKAMLENTDVSQYSMYWQVDGGGLVQMNNSSQDWPHKEALVDLSGWHWKGGGPYTITFVSKDQGGNTISQKSVQIWTQ